MRKSNRRQLVGGVIAGGALAAVGMVAPGVWADQATQAELKAAAARLEAARVQARKLGIPLVPEDLAVTVPADQNAASLYQELQRRWDRMPEEEALEKGACLLRRKTEVDRQQARQVLQEWRPLVDLAEQIAALPVCDFALKWEDVPDFPFPPYTAMRAAARLLAAKALVVGEDGQVDDACRTLATSGQILRHMNTVPMILSFTVMMVTSNYLDDVFRHLLRLHAMKPAALSLLGDTHRAISTSGDLRQCLRGEALFYQSAARKPHQWIQEQIPGDAGAEDLDIRTEAQKRVDAQLLRCPEPLVSAALEARLLEGFAQFFSALDVAGADPYSLRTGLEPLIAREKARSSASFRLSAHLAREMEAWGQYPAQVVARERLREAALDLLSVHHRTGAFPETLPRSVHDPFDGEPLRYRRQNRGFLLYSVGADLKDDGGSTELAVGGSRDLVLAYP